MGGRKGRGSNESAHSNWQTYIQQRRLQTNVGMQESEGARNATGLLHVTRNPQEAMEMIALNRRKAAAKVSSGGRHMLLAMPQSSLRPLHTAPRQNRPNVPLKQVPRDVGKRSKIRHSREFSAPKVEENRIPRSGWAAPGKMQQVEKYVTKPVVFQDVRALRELEDFLDKALQDMDNNQIGIHGEKPIGPAASHSCGPLHLAYLMSCHVT